MKVQLHRLTRREMMRAASYYCGKRVGLRDAFLDEIAVVVGRIKASPLLMAPFVADLRIRLVERFPCYLVYTVRSDVAVMLAVAHNSRRQSYWRRRLTRP